MVKKITDITDVCKDCAEYGSHFCEECLEELQEGLTEDQKTQLNKALLGLAKAINDR